MEIAAQIGLLGPLSVTVALVVLGILSKRLGEQTHAKRHYLGFYAAALLMLLSTVAQLILLFDNSPRTPNNLTWILVADGVPALAVTVGVIYAWRYWSWLLAERD